MSEKKGYFLNHFTHLCVAHRVKYVTSSAFLTGTTEARRESLRYCIYNEFFKILADTTINSAIIIFGLLNRATVLLSI